jgi:hypothetical protein
MSPTESGTRGAWDAYLAAILTGLLSGMTRTSFPELGPGSPMIWACVILYAGTISLASLSTTDRRRRIVRMSVCVPLVLGGMILGAIVARMLE